MADSLGLVAQFRHHGRFPEQYVIGWNRVARGRGNASDWALRGHSVLELEQHIAVQSLRLFADGEAC